VDVVLLFDDSSSEQAEQRAPRDNRPIAIE
jgi:hypothetical protein